jgi:ankyrin repeat protein
VPCDAVDGIGQTPLMLAAAEGHALVCVFLLERGADLGARDDNSWSALHHAVDADQTDAALALVAAGAAVDDLTKGGRSLKHLNYALGEQCEEAADMAAEVARAAEQVEEIEVTPPPK